MAAFGANDLQTNTGETVADTARVFAGYLDLLVMRTYDRVQQMTIFCRSSEPVRDQCIER